MAGQQQQNQASKLQSKIKEQEFERRQLNSTGIIISFIVMLAVGVCDTIGVFDALSFLFSGTPWAAEVKATVFVVAGLVFLGAGGFGIWSAKQNSG